MHLVHKAGEKTFIDFSGKTIDIINPKNGVITKAELFIAVLPASGFAFIKAIASQKKRDFIDAHADMFEYLTLRTKDQNLLKKDYEKTNKLPRTLHRLSNKWKWLCNSNRFISNDGK